MGWNESQGRVSGAFNDWYFVDRDQRTFLGFGFRIAREAHDRLWDEAGREPGDPDGPDQLDVFEEKIDGLWLHDYEWMHSAAVLRDAVTNFEVYLEKAAKEILVAHGASVERSSPRWHELVSFFDVLGEDFESEQIREVRELRHFLTHQRGEFRTKEHRSKFSRDSAEPIPLIVVELDGPRVIEAMDQLADSVRSVDPAIWEYIYGRARASDVGELARTIGAVVTRRAGYTR